MRSLAELGIALSAVFGIFVLALLAELWYIFHWKKSGSTKCFLRCLKSAAEMKAGNAEFVREASLVGSFGGYPSACTEVVGAGAGGSDYGDQAPHILFPIKEETKEDLELATGGAGGTPKPNSRLRSRTPSDVLAVPFTSGSGSSSPAASVDSSFTSPPSSPPTAKLSPYAARAVRQVSCSARASSSSSSPVGDGAGARPVRNGRAGRTPLQLLFERSPLLGPGAHMPSPFWLTGCTAAKESSNASPSPFYHRGLSLAALFGQSPTACPPPSQDEHP